MVGKLILNSRYVIFHIYEPRYSGLLQNARLASTGKVMSLPLDKIVDVSVETGVRARSSRPNWKSRDDFERKMSGEKAINSHPGLLDGSEKYSKILLTVETENGIEIASFEVSNPQAWEQSLKTHFAKSTN